MYKVHIVAGDPSNFDSVYKYNAEGVLTVNGTPSSSSRWKEGTQTVSITDSTSGASIFYTLDGTQPTTSSTQYTGSFLVLTTTTVKAIAVRSGWSQSAVAIATYTMLLF